MTEDRPVRVLHLITRLSQGGGIQIVIRRLAEGLDPDQVDLHVLTVRPRRPEDRLEDLPATVHYLGYTWKGYPLRVRPRVMFAVAQCARRVKPDVIHLHSGVAWLGVLARVVLPRTRFVLEVHDAPGSGRHGRVTDRVEGWWPKWLGAVALCHSSSVATEVRTRWKVPDRQVVCFPLAVDTDLFVPADPAQRRSWRRHEGIDEEAVALLGVGRLARSKRFDRVIDAVAEMRSRGHNVVGMIVGRGDERESLRAHAVERGVEEHVHFLGARYGADLAAAVSSGDILCSPSEYEGFGLTIVEGMASGLPVIANAVGGVTDLVDDGVTGFLVGGDGLISPDGPHVRLITDSDLRSVMGAAGRQRAVERFSSVAFCRAVTHLYWERAP